MQKIRRHTTSGPKYTRGPFETETAEQGRAITVELHPTFILLRLKGLRAGLMLPYSAAYLKAAQFKARELQLAKVQARRQKQMARKAGTR